ncbi:MAG: hypothetical protein L0322_20265 [Chloroflexi bacterium]|nr:hypothetical protein [Chloroflexota bacterium]MCI0645675.1 hypothetical protein [Chloroflexota bacterium]
MNRKILFVLFLSIAVYISACNGRSESTPPTDATSTVSQESAATSTMESEATTTPLPAATETSAPISDVPEGFVVPPYLQARYGVTLAYPADWRLQDTSFAWQDAALQTGKETPSVSI